MGSNSDESDEFLRAIKICSRTPFGGKVKLLAPCHKFLKHDKYRWRYDRDTYWQNSAIISHLFSPCFATRCAATRVENWWMNRE
jgi:hypothetical protein